MLKTVCQWCADCGGGGWLTLPTTQSHIIYRTHLINCNTHHSPSSALLLCVHTRYNLFAHSSCTSLVILIFIKSTVDCIAHFSSLHILLLILCYCFYLLSSFLSYYYLYLNICSCVVYHLLFLFFLHCPLSGPVLTSISLLIIPCMIVYVTNKREPWTLNPQQNRNGGACNETFAIIEKAILVVFKCMNIIMYK